ncbi:Non-heme 11 kDa protein of cytochrome bc1 complex [Coprinopsis sp. MPI-PUGE-AT-0042]|nr:Non-heme 11 kDa protein of cytochrome bc1 complex [Coprinopsis sp. MPI-PUGE-AT-0042]
MSSITSLFSSLFSSEPIYNDSEKAAPEPEKEEPEAQEEEAPAEEEEEEPEDLQPVIREECKTERCAALAKHFEHCQEKVQAGEGFKGEDCVEELMMHCIDDCAGPKLFSKLA